MCFITKTNKTKTSSQQQCVIYALEFIKKKYGQAFCEIIPHRLPLLSLQPRHAHEQNHETNAEYGPEECKKKRKKKGLSYCKDSCSIFMEISADIYGDKTKKQQQTNKLGNF